jgi:hypothetical protein
MIIPKDLVEKLGSDVETIYRNTLRLTSKPDIRKTTLFLADWIHGRENPGTEIEVPGAYNFLTEAIPESRTCEEARIPSWYCAT